MRGAATIVYSLEELGRYASGFLRGLAKAEEGATVVGLIGDLGSGKTAFTKIIARELGVIDAVLSPTFVLAKFYAIPDHPRWKRLAHIDCYRIEDADEIAATRWGELLADRETLVIVEWPEILGDQFPATANMLRFAFVDDTTRAIEVLR